MNKKKKYTYIDLFAGCGGLSLGLHQSGWKGLFAIEKSPDAFLTLKHNLIDKVPHFDWPSWLKKDGEPCPIDISDLIKNFKIPLLELKNQVDLVAGGPPCQGFSMAGRRKESDQRNNLIKKYIKFIKLVQPKILFFENVRGFTLEFKKNRDKGKKYSTYVENALKRAGYYVKGQLVNFDEYGIPQKRTRFILVGVRKDIPGASKKLAESFFLNLKLNRENFLSDRNISNEVGLKDAISDLLKYGNEIALPGSKRFKAGKYAPVLTPYQELMRRGVVTEMADSHRFPNHSPEIIKKFNHILQNNSRKNKDIDTDIRLRFAINKHTIVPLAPDEKCPTITSLPDDYIHYSEPRILTVREYARIQSFPDWYEIKGKYTTGGKKRIFEVPRYTQIGNAIPPLFGEQSGLILKQFFSS